MNNIESILAAVNSLSDSDLKILVNRIMDRLHPENALASAVKIAPRLKCPVCHTNGYVVKNGHKHGKQAFLCAHVVNHLLQRVTHFYLARTTAAKFGEWS